MMNAHWPHGSDPAAHVSLPLAGWEQSAFMAELRGLLAALELMAGLCHVVLDCWPVVRRAHGLAQGAVLPRRLGGLNTMM